MTKLQCATQPSSAQVFWYVEGHIVEGEGTLYADDTALAQISELSGDFHTLKLRPFLPGTIDITCLAKSDENYAVDAVAITRSNNTPSQPTLTLPGTGSTIVSLDENSTLSFSAIDPDGDAITYIVQISENRDFSDAMEITVTNGTFRLSDISDSLRWGSHYYIRVKATDGTAESSWSEARFFYYHLNLPVFISYWEANGTSPIYRTITDSFAHVDLSSLAEGFGGFEITGDTAYLDNEMVEIYTDATLSGSPIFTQTLYSMDEDTAYWTPDHCGHYYIRIVYTIEDANGSHRQIASPVHHLLLVPPAPTPVLPAENQSFSHHSRTLLRVNAVTDPNHIVRAEAYLFELSSTSDFSRDINESGELGTNEWNATLPTLVGEPYRRTYFWRAKIKCHGIWSDWSESRSIEIVNHFPVPVDERLDLLSGHEAEDSTPAYPKLCIDTVMKIIYSTEDPDLDPIERTVMHVNGKDFNATMDAERAFLTLSAREIGYGKNLYLEAYPYDIYGAHPDADWYAEFGQSEAIHLSVVNCPPFIPTDTNLSGPGATMLIIPGQELYFTATGNPDPDGDTIDRYDLQIQTPEGNTTLEAPFSSRGYAAWTYTPPTEGNYTWRMRAVSRLKDDTLQIGAWSSERSFAVVPPPPAVPVAPEDGAIFFDDTNTSIHLSATVPPEVNASLIRAYQFEWSTTESFEESTTSSHVAPEEAKDFATSMSVGTDWYWRVRASYPNTDGPWSEPRCLSYWKSSAIREYHPLARVELLAYDASNDTVSIRVEPLEMMKSCRGSYGTIYYDISSDENGTDSVTKGVLDENGTVTFKKVEGVERYYLAIRQQFDYNHATDYGERVTFSLAAATLETVGYWSFDECDATDFASGHRGDIIGEPTCYESNLMEGGKMLYFHGDEEGLGIDFAPDLNLSSFTISLWLKPMATDGIFPLFGPIDGSGYGLQIVDGRPEGYLNIEAEEAPFKVRGVGLPTGGWSHLLLTYDGVELTLYQNGKVAGSVVAHGTPKMTGKDFGIAIRMGGEEEASFFKGYLEEVKLYRGSVDARKADAIMHERVKENEEFFLPLETVGAKPLSGDLPLEVTFYAEPGGSGSYLWDFEGSGYYDKSQLSSEATHTYRRVGTYKAVVMRESAGGDWQRVEVNVTAPANMIAYWSMDDCSPDDATGKHVTERHGDVQCMAEGVNEEALKFDGSSAYLRAYGKSDLTPADLTISLWFQTNGEAGRQSLLHYGSYDIEYEEGVVYAHIRLSEGEGPVELYEKADVEPGSWVHVVVTFDRHDFILYINGEKAASTVAEGVLAGTDEDLYLAAGGADERTGDPVDPYEGALDEVYLFNEVLSMEELEKL